MPISRELSKWLATMRVSWSQQLAYKLNFLLLVIGPVLIFFFIRYSLWSAIYRLEGITEIQGYTFTAMLAYQVWVMVIGFLGQGYNGRELSLDIRQGQISAYLLYPFGFWAYHCSCFLANQCLQLGITGFTLLWACGLGWVQISSLTALIHGILFSCCVGIFWFQVNFLLGLIAFWLEETWVLRVMMVTISQFFSGALLPLEIFPLWLNKILVYTPFPYLTHIPVKIFMGEYTGSWLAAYSILGGWILGISALTYWVWGRGLRLYTAAGM